MRTGGNMAIEQNPARAGGGGDAPLNTEQTVERTRNFVQETIVELKKSTWPTRAEATRLTSVVVGVIVGVGIYMGLLDSILTLLVSKFSLIK